MPIRSVAFHYPRPEHFEEFVGRAHRVGEVVGFDEREQEPCHVYTLLPK
ncbi:hypothetical protein ACTWQF_08420 [Streptomyces sp. 8N114]